MNQLTLRSVSFSYESSDKIIIQNLDASFSQGWTALVGPNGCGKSTLLKILAGAFAPTKGDIIGANLVSYYCRQETDQAPDELEDFCLAYDKDAFRLKSSLGLHGLLVVPWKNLSQGEQKRFQLACALWRKPDVLLIDEPTNHLDAKNRQFIVATLSQYKGIGVLVSHDRQLLNTICSRCLFFVADRIHDFPGNYDAAVASLEGSRASVEKQRGVIKQAVSALASESTRLKQVTQQTGKRLSKRHLDRKDHDAKGRIDAARLTGKDASLGQKQLNIETRISRLQHELGDLEVVKDYSGSIFFGMQNRSSKVLLHSTVEKVPLASGRDLFLPELVIRGQSKIGIKGLNGVGKSSLLRFLMEYGSFNASLFYLKQELSLNEVASLQKQLSDLKSDEFARCLQIVARLGSDAGQVLKNRSWSPGESRKIAIAMAIVTGIELLILDEPTNHLDLPSIQNLEKALAESGLALLIVSHDCAFLDAICEEYWEIEQDQRQNSHLQIGGAEPVA